MKKIENERANKSRKIGGIYFLFLKMSFDLLSLIYLFFDLSSFRYTKFNTNDNFFHFKGVEISKYS